LLLVGGWGSWEISGNDLGLFSRGREPGCESSKMEKYPGGLKAGMYCWIARPGERVGKPKKRLAGRGTVEENRRKGRQS